MTSSAYKLPFSCVVDASVGIKLFLTEHLSDRAHVVFAQLGDDPPPRLYVPDPFYVECANILLKYVRRFGYPPESARANVADLVSLTLIRTPTAALAAAALELAVAHDLSAYDACYIALSARVGVPMLTADERLVRLLADTEHEVLWLGDC